ncbi:MAG: metallophosphoesterase [Clostridia bacterium]|nr:metallophosphoesterase [Clostridia bacterium]
MAVYVMADTHLSLAVNKPMHIFGSRWTDHPEKIRKNWLECVRPEDTVVIPGDLSWGINLEESLADFRFIDDLPGNKILLKGNHDYWWDTVTKMTAFNAENKLTHFSYLHNNAIRCEDFILCGSRGWYTEDKKVITQNEVDTAKIVAREVGRLHTSLEAGKKIHDEVLETEGRDLEMLVFLHFPPYFKGYICDEIILELYRFGIERCYFGHIHGSYDVPAMRKYMDIEFRLIAADFLNFRPLLIDVRR